MEPKSICLALSLIQLVGCHYDRVNIFQNINNTHHIVVPCACDMQVKSLIHDILEPLHCCSRYQPIWDALYPFITSSQHWLIIFQTKYIAILILVWFLLQVFYHRDPHMAPLSKRTLYALWSCTVCIGKDAKISLENIICLECLSLHRIWFLVVLMEYATEHSMVMDTFSINLEGSNISDCVNQITCNLTWQCQIKQSQCHVC